MNAPMTNENEQQQKQQQQQQQQQQQYNDETNNNKNMNNNNNNIINGMSMMRRMVIGNDNDSNNTIMTIPAISHRAMKERRRLEGGNGNEEEEEVVIKEEEGQVGALYQGYGTHYVDLWVGTPKPQRQTVIVDTGSSITGFPCSTCDDCGHSFHTDEYFMELKSDTFLKQECGDCVHGTRCIQDNCHIRISYQEGSSWTAYESTDMVYLGGPHDDFIPAHHNNDNNFDDKDIQTGEDPMNANHYSFRLTFGCQTKITGLFKTQLADGIMGMANKKGAFFQQIANSGTVHHLQFSLCFSRPSTAERDGTEAGAITLGGKDVRMHYDPMVYAANIKSSGFYSVHLRNMYLRNGGGESVITNNPKGGKPFFQSLNMDESRFNTGGIILDSGTTDCYFNTVFQKPFQDLWKQLTGSDWLGENGIKLTEEELHQLPTIIFQLSAAQEGEGNVWEDTDEVVGLAGTYLDAEHPTDVLVAMPATHYLDYDADEDEYTPRIYFEERGGSVLGANFFTGHDVHFDVEHGRIGFSESHCDYDQLVEQSKNNKEGEFFYPGSPYRQQTIAPPFFQFPQNNNQSSIHNNNTPGDVPVGAVTSILAIVCFFIGLTIYVKNRMNQKAHNYQPTPESELSDISESSSKMDTDFENANVPPCPPELT